MNLNSILPVGTSEKVSVDLLIFDANNPRFTPDKMPASPSDDDVVLQLARSADLAELVQSISTSGYINIEPLIVIERGGFFAVLEGNRRLAAVKVLRNPELARQARLSLPPMDADKRPTLNKLLCYRVAAEADARDLIGFKHINGPQGWDAFAKARFAARWLDDEHAKPGGMTLADIAGRMGDQHMTIHRMVTAKFVLDQAESDGVYSIDDRKKKSFSFSHLYTGLAYDEFTSYLGMERADRSLDPVRNPVGKSRYGELRHLLTWLYGSKDRDIAPVIKSQNPDLNRLREVLGSKVGTKVLEERGSLDEAVVAATPVRLRFEEHLIAANAELQHAVSALEGFDAQEQPEMIQISESALKKARLIKTHIESEITNLVKAPEPK
ncbi:ParB N-terminal domain-containing protein [Pseudohoeflea coraliihabitans]|uniref:ParB N-terminal domain-containing protein n=1 Tax=Pseudohoeflea coraliihabitans TaxID=2860393 RepID=A0ABS6WSF0_9HYPH|nr:ParB N-terminal domain-containing protein [Pseudohoeflea sp. DP4N28-3]MBW3098861.1 ParB N-terminal domain-containing protein [Pseudohoeflea sp. DP4N28-3]